MRSVVQNLLDASVRMIGSNPISSPADAPDELGGRPDAMEKLEGRLPRIERAFVVWLLLALIQHKEHAIFARPCDAD